MIEAIRGARIGEIPVSRRRLVVLTTAQTSKAGYAARSAEATRQMFTRGKWSAESCFQV